MLKLSKLSFPVIENRRTDVEPAGFAGRELERYLRAVLGAEAADPGEGRIVLDCGDAAGIEGEGFTVGCRANELHVSGAGPAGLVYGVYDVLKRECGCIFAGYAPDGEYVPVRESLELPDFQRKRKPELWYRGMQFSVLADDPALMVRRIDWMAKNGFNYVMYMPRHAEGESLRGGMWRFFSDDWFFANLAPEVAKRGMKLDMDHHNLWYWLPPDVYFADHPEWYPLRDGKRTRGTRPEQLCVCTSNLQALDTLAANVLAYLDRRPEVKMVGVIAEDYRALPCECKECRKLDDPSLPAFDPREEDFLKRQSPNMANRYARLVNHVAGAVSRKHPDVKVGMMAYSSMTIPPDRVELDPNVFPWVAAWKGCGVHTIDDPGCRTNRQHHEVFKRWAALVPGRAIYYAYYMGTHGQHACWYPLESVISRDWDMFKALGFGGGTLQSIEDNHYTYGVNYMTFARCGWDRHVDPDDVRAEWTTGMFGPAAGAEIKKILDAFDAAFRKAEQQGHDVSPYLRMYSYYLPGFRDNVVPDAHNIAWQVEVAGRAFIEECVAEARRLARTDREKRQVELMSNAVLYWLLFADLTRAFCDFQHTCLEHLEKKGCAKCAEADKKRMAVRLLKDKVVEHLSGSRCLAGFVPKHTVKRIDNFYTWALSNEYGEHFKRKN